MPQSCEPRPAFAAKWPGEFTRHLSDSFPMICQKLPFFWRFIFEVMRIKMFGHDTPENRFRFPPTNSRLSEGRIGLFHLVYHTLLSDKVKKERKNPIFFKIIAVRVFNTKTRTTIMGFYCRFPFLCRQAQGRNFRCLLSV